VSTPPVSGAPGGPAAPAIDLHQVVECMHEGVIVRDASGAIVYVNASAARILRRAREDLLGRTALTERGGIRPDGSPFPPSESAATVALATGEDTVDELVGLEAGDGELRWISVNARALRDGDAVTGVVTTLVDVTEHRAAVAARRRAEEALRDAEARFRKAFDHAPIGKALVSTEGRFTRVNAALCAMLGHGEQELLALDFQTITHPDDLDADLEQLRALRTRDIDAYSMEKRYRRADGAYVWAQLDVSAVRDDAGTPLYFVSQIQDVSEQKAQAARLTELTLHDPLTGLANRVHFGDRLEHAVERARRSRSGVAVLFVDFDRFKEVNDSFGHATGDELLRQAARRMQRAVRPADTVARLGGDEFTVLCEDIGIRDAGWVADRVCVALERPFSVLGNRTEIGVSVGVAIAEHGDSAEALLAKADAAMYCRKHERRDVRGAA
jgi:diguanylate cyclase (GGDEF)-like protein/PAS domain S-box-containing protein